jgi:hypothetical protein
MQAEWMNKHLGQGMNDCYKKSGLKHYFKFYEKWRFISNGELFVRVALFSPKTGWITGFLKLKFKKYLIC